MRFFVLQPESLDNTYTYYSLPYAGKPEVVDRFVSKYYMTGTDKYAKYLVKELA